MRAVEEFRLFEALARSRHFGRASAECHISQPALSRSIQRFEAELGVRLFDRDRRSVTLTGDGVRFLALAREVLAAWDEYAAARAANDEIGGEVSLFCTVTAAQSILPEVLTRFRLAHPNVHLDLRTGYAAEALQQLDEGRVDVTVAALPTRTPRHLLTSVLVTTDVVFVAPAQAMLDLPTVPSGAWSNVPFVLPKSGLVRALVDQWLRRLRIRPTIAAEAEGHEAVLTLVALGCGIGAVPRPVASASPLAGRIRIVSDVVGPKFDIAACTTADRLGRPPVRALWQKIVDPAGATHATD